MNRPYQDECLATMAEEHTAGIHGQLINLCTAAGKTRIAACLPSKVPSTGGRTLFLVSGEELVWQAQATFARLNPDLCVGVEKADRHADITRHDIVIASIQSISLKKRLATFRPDAFGQIGIDETHGVSDGGRFHDVLRHFHALKSEANYNPDTLLYGLTATTQRSDGIGLEHTYSKITFTRTLLDLMRDGITIAGKLYPYIADIECHRIDTYADLTKVRTTDRELDKDELANAIDTPERNRIVVETYQKLGDGLPAFGWPVNLAHAHHVAQAFCEAGIRAIVMEGSTPAADRKHMFAGLDDGSLKVILSVGVLREGIDRERVTVGLMLTPHKSSLPYIQKVGRIVRPCPAPEEMLQCLKTGDWPPYVKRRARLFDFVDQAGRHNLVGAGSLFGLRNNFRMDGRSALETISEIERIEERLKIDARRHESIYEIRSFTEKVDILKPPQTPPQIRKWSRLQWLEVTAGSWCLSLRSGRSIRIRRNQLGQYEIWFYDRGFGRKDWIEATLRDAIERADKTVPHEEFRFLSEDAAHRNQPPTEQQCAYLYRMDKAIRLQFQDCKTFWQAMMTRYNSGDNNAGKGAVTAMINAKTAARPMWLQKKIGLYKRKNAAIA